MPIAESVDHQNVDVAGHHEQVLTKRSEHVPWIQVEEGCHKVETKGRSKCDNDNTRSGGGDKGLDKISRGATCIQRATRAARESVNDQVEGVDDDVKLDNGVHHKRDNV